MSDKPQTIKEVMDMVDEANAAIEGILAELVRSTGLRIVCIELREIQHEDTLPLYAVSVEMKLSGRR